MRRNTILFVVVILLVGLIYWVSGYTYIEVAASNNMERGKLELSILNQKGSKQIAVSEEAASIKKLVRRGNYQIEVRQGLASYFAVVSARGFLRTNKVDAKLSGEISREFVGNNPKACVDWDGSLLISWQCQGAPAAAIMHLPASDSISTKNQPVKEWGDVAVEAVFSNDGKRYLLAKSENMHQLYVLDATNRLDKNIARTLNDLSGAKNFRATVYKEGFLLFSQDGQDLYYYESFENTPTKIPSALPETPGLELYSANALNNSVLLTFNQHQVPEHTGAMHVLLGNVASEEFEEHDEGVKQKENESLNITEVVVLANNQVRGFKLDYAADMARLCGDKKLCTLQGKTMNIYDISGGKAKKLYSVEGVEQIENSGGKILAVKENGIVIFNADSRSGYFEYTFGEYKFCGFKTFEEKYVLCVREGKQKSVLLLNQGEPVTDYIDQQILQLSKHASVKTIVPYGAFIHVSPEIGELVINPVTGEFEYDQEVITRVNLALKEKIDQLGINLRKYKIINPFE